MICVRCINCSYNNIAKGIRLLDKYEKTAIFMQEKNHTRAFESSVPLSLLKISLMPPGVGGGGLLNNY